MRLENYEICAIKESFSNIFKEGSIYLFGSRVNDGLKGGDIDLYIDTKNRINLIGKKNNFLVDVKSKIGDQKIDIVIARDKTRRIEQEAISKGILL